MKQPYAPSPSHPAASPSRRAAGPRAFTLLELLFAVAMLGLFMILFSQLFMSTQSIAHRVPREDANAARVEMVMGVLRRDVWRAQKIDVPDGDHVTLRAAGDQIVTWSRRDNGELSRQATGAAAADRRDDAWQGLDALRGFAAAPTGVTVTLHERVLQRDSRVLVTSQVLAAGRASP